MALFVQHKETRSELQETVATDLRNRAEKKAKDAERPDGITDSQFIKGSKESSGLLWLWLLIAGLVIVGVILLTVSSTS